MTRTKIAILIGVLILIGLTASTVPAGAPKRADLPEYVGSQACLGCHSDKYQAWEETLHATNTRQLVSPTDYPADPSLAPAELKSELDKADFMWHDRRFLAQDPATGELKYLNVQWNQQKNQYETYKGGGVWSNSCGGCHSGAVNSGTHKTQVEAGISCENCHGPGRDHILGKGDRSKIVSSTESSKVCAQCHSGYNALPNSTRFAEGYRPGTPIEEFPSFQTKVYDNSVPPPFFNNETRHLQQYPQWKASGHANATNLLIARGPTYLARSECIKCHSTGAGKDIAAGKTWDFTTMLENDGVSCSACHSAHGSPNKADLKMEPQALCVSCHSIGRGDPKPVTIGTTRAPHSNQADMFRGSGAIGIPETKSIHEAVTCVECHMSEGNHMMKVVKPFEAMITEKRTDSCSACHTGSSAEVRGAYLSLWQNNVSLLLASVQADVEAIDAKLKADSTVLSEELTKKYQEARANFWYVQKDGSKGAHNFEYSFKILKTVTQEMAKIKEALPK